jgi:capsular exopolysaccharide synthesis family protein
LADGSGWQLLQALPNSAQDRLAEGPRHGLFPPPSLAPAPEARARRHAGDRVFGRHFAAPRAVLPRFRRGYTLAAVDGAPESTAMLRPPSPESQQGALGPYLRALAAHPLLVVVVVLLSLVGSVAYLSHRSAHYKATADILFNPLPSNTQGANGLPLLRESGEASRLSQTAVSLLNTRQAAAAAAARLGREWTPTRVAQAITVQPQGQSDIIAITGEAGSPVGAELLANTYALATLSVRRELLRRQAASLLPELATRTPGPNEPLAQETHALLLALKNGQDPNFSLSQTANRPASPTGTATWLVIVLSLVAGFAIASVAVVVIELVSDRTRTSEELLEMYGLPVLAYVPALPRRNRPRPPLGDTARSRHRETTPRHRTGLRRLGLGGRRSPRPRADAVAMPPDVQEAFRMIRVQLDSDALAMREQADGGRTILVTSASSGDGKTTAVVSLGTALAEAEKRVILLDLDLRKPDLCRATGLTRPQGVTSLIMNGKDLDSVLTRTEIPGVTVLPAGPGASAQLLQPVVAQMSDLGEQLRDVADYVIIDTPPLGEISDAYQLLPFADEIVIVARPDNTRRTSFRFMRDLLSRANRVPRGMIIMGETVNPIGYYYAQNHAGENRLRRWLDRARIAQ